MDLKKKLNRLSASMPAPQQAPQTPEPVVSPVSDQVSLLRQRMAAIMQRPAFGAKRNTDARVQKQTPLCSDVLLGNTIETPHGSVHLIERRYPLDAKHGDESLGAIVNGQSEHLALLGLDADLRDLSPQRLLFLDTETTGLAGGSGTLPFLIGLAWCNESEWVVQQLLLLRPGEEGPMLLWLAERLQASSGLVTYNGKSFDWPLLRARFTLNRVPVPHVPLHLDVLHAARRVFKKTTADMRLITLEQQVLAFYRGADIAGHEIPERYFSFLRGGNAGLLNPIIEHNAWDLLSLVGLLGALENRIAAPDLRHAGAEHLALAHLSERANDAKRALQFAASAADLCEDPAQALLLSAKLLRRTGDFRQAEALLLQANERGRDQLILAHVNLALTKLYEHQLREPSRALVHARAAIYAEDAEAHQQRIERLQKKLAV